MEVEFNIPADLIRAHARQKAEKVAPKVKLKGFRPGKAAKRLVGQLFGGRAWVEAAEELATGQIAQKIAVEGLVPVAIPGFDEPAKKGQDFTGTLEVETLPQVGKLVFPKAITLEDETDFEERSSQVELALDDAVRKNALKPPSALVSAMEKLVMYEFIAFCERGGQEPHLGAGDYNLLKNHAIRRADHMCFLHEVKRHHDLETVDQAMQLFLERISPDGV